MKGFGFGFGFVRRMIGIISDFPPFSWGSIGDTWDDLDMITWDEMEP